MLGNVLRTLLRWLMVFAMLIFLGIALLLTPMGLKATLYAISKIVPGEIHYRQVSGTLLSPIAIQQLSYRHEDRQIIINRVYWRWYPWLLLKGKLVISNAIIDQVQITAPLHYDHPHPSPFALKQRFIAFNKELSNWHFPFSLEIKQATINKIWWGGKPYHYPTRFGKTSLSLLYAPNALQIKIAAALAKPYATQIQLLVKGTPRYYHIQSTVFNPHMHWIITGQGTRQYIHLDTRQAIIFGGQVSAHILWQWAAVPFKWEISATARHLDMSQFGPNFPRPLNLQLNTIGFFGEEHPFFSWKAIINSPQTQIITHGKREDQWDAYWNITIKQLAELIPFSSGSIITSGYLRGTLMGTLNPRQTHCKFGTLAGYKCRQSFCRLEHRYQSATKVLFFISSGTSANKKFPSTKFTTGWPRELEKTSVIRNS